MQNHDKISAMYLLTEVLVYHRTVFSSALSVTPQRDPDKLDKCSPCLFLPRLWSTRHAILFPSLILLFLLSHSTLHRSLFLLYFPKAPRYTLENKHFRGLERTQHFIQPHQHVCPFPLLPFFFSFLLICSDPYHFPSSLALHLHPSHPFLLLPPWGVEETPLKKKKTSQSTTYSALWRKKQTFSNDVRSSAVWELMANKRGSDERTKRWNWLRESEGEAGRQICGMREKTLSGF